MRTLHTLLATATILTSIHGQYGTFEPAAVKNAKNTTTVVVLDGGGTPYDRALMEAVKSHWTFTGNTEFVTTAEMAARPIVPEQTYLMKVSRTDPVKFEGTFLMLVQGWKAKKGESLTWTAMGYTNVPSSQELASLLIDAKALNEGPAGPMTGLYVKHLQDYLKLVEGGKVRDKATADRTYAGRTRLIREHDLLLAKEHLDKSLPGTDQVKEHYTARMSVKTLADVVAAVERQDAALCVSDVVITMGDHRNKHCFKRVWNAGTGELMYQNDDQAIFGKKEGFIDTDLKNLERAR
ncbi:MAG: hypothetical protein KIT10_10145 [Flavobacteriales bacterium]|nr:hypothetical protein [Flavobacteriales bacterium]